MASRSSADPAKVGMMDGAFFVSRGELLNWVNDFFQLGLSKVEQCANGAVYCQIIDACHPGMVAMRKLNWMARTDHEHIPNYKVLQAAFDKCQIQRNIDVDKLIRGRYQDNLEMLQWMKHYFDSRFKDNPEQYDPIARRSGQSLPDWTKPSSASAKDNGKSSDGGQRSSEGGQRMAPTGVRPGSARTAGNAVPTPTRASQGGGSASSKTGAPRPKTPGGSGSAGGGGYGSGPREVPAAHEKSSPGNSNMMAEHESLKEEVVDLKITVDGLECERDYYFRKLRDIEILCQTLEADPSAAEQVTVAKIIQNVQAILYARDEDDPPPEV